MTDDTDANYLRAAALAFQMDDPIRLRLMEIAERLPRPVCDDKELTAIARALAAKNEAEQRELRAAQEADELRTLADSEGTRAVEYLRRARAAEAEANKSERRAIAFGDIVEGNVIAMQAAVIEGHLKTPAHGLQWIVNVLKGPGQLPNLDEARALGGAQAWWDRETAKHEEFRREHPGPAALGPNVNSQTPPVR